MRKRIRRKHQRNSKFRQKYFTMIFLMSSLSVQVYQFTFFVLSQITTFYIGTPKIPFLTFSCFFVFYHVDICEIQVNEEKIRGDKDIRIFQYNVTFIKQNIYSVFSIFIFSSDYEITILKCCYVLRVNNVPIVMTVNHLLSRKK